MTSKKIARFIASGALVLAGAAATGCSQDGATGGSANGADSIAYHAAMGLEDETARLDGLLALQERHPDSKFADRAYPRIVSLTRTHRPDRVEAVLREALAADIEESRTLNAIGWPLAEDGEHLDLAVSILEKAVALAREEGDPEELAACLDSHAWALHKRGDSEAAVAPMEEAFGIYGSEHDEITRHMALIYDAAGRDAEALPLYVSLLGHSESPRIRERLEAVARETGGSLAEIEARIRDLRIAGISPAPELVFPSLADGTPVSLEDLRGQVVLVSFWHPT